MSEKKLKSTQIVLACGNCGDKGEGCINCPVPLNKSDKPTKTKGKMNKNKGRKFENDFVKTINSGAFFHDADAKSNNNMLEIKYTEKKSFSITTKILRKIWEQAFDNNKLPLLGIGIKDDKDLWMLRVDIIRKRI